MFVGNAEDIGLADGGMVQEYLFDFARVDVFAAANDHLFFAAANVDVAVGVHDGEVARVKPSGRVDGFSGGVRVVPVAGHDGIAPGAQFALLAAVDDAPGGWVGNFDFEVRDGFAD